MIVPKIAFSIGSKAKNVMVELALEENITTEEMELYRQKEIFFVVLSVWFW